MHLRKTCFLLICCFFFQQLQAQNLNLNTNTQVIPVGYNATTPITPAPVIRYAEIKKQRPNEIVIPASFSIQIDQDFLFRFPLTKNEDRNYDRRIRRGRSGFRRRAQRHEGSYQRFGDRRRSGQYLRGRKTPLAHNVNLSRTGGSDRAAARGRRHPGSV